MEMEKAPFEDEELSFLSEKGALPVGSMSQPASQPSRLYVPLSAAPPRARVVPPAAVPPLLLFHWAHWLGLHARASMIVTPLPHVEPCAFCTLLRRLE